MRNSTKRNSTRAAAAVIAVLVSTSSVHAGNRDAADVEKKLQAMANADTDWHPDLAGEFNGMRYYMHGKYGSAMEQFKHGAYYADKLSQLCIGLMYLNGQGVAKDPVAAYAWLDLAAERSYPEFIATRDRVKAVLTVEQLQQAAQMRTQLASVYADAVAKRRLATQLALGQMQLTGSHTGFDSGVSALPAEIFSMPSGAAAAISIGRCSGLSISVGYSEVPISGCGGDSVRYARAFWDPAKYFAGRDALWNTKVTVGPVQDQTKLSTSDTDKKP